MPALVAQTLEATPFFRWTDLRSVGIMGDFCGSRRGLDLEDGAGNQVSRAPVWRCFLEHAIQGLFWAI